MDISGLIKNNYCWQILAVAKMARRESISSFGLAFIDVLVTIKEKLIVTKGKVIKVAISEPHTYSKRTILQSKDYRADPRADGTERRIAKGGSFDNVGARII